MRKDTSEKKAHATFSASGAERWLNCPGSVKLSEGVPPLPGSPWAKEGTDAHACFEFLLKNHKHPLGKITSTARKKWDANMVEHGLSARSYVLKRMSELTDAAMLVEAKIDSSSFTCAGQFGTVDVALVGEFDRLIVIDYKYGAGYAVEPENNPQLIYYALGIAHQYHYNFETIELVIIQPRAYHESGESIRSTVMSASDVMAYIDTFKRGVKAAKSPNPVLKAGAWCRYCPAVIVCPQIKKDALEQANIDFDNIGDSLPTPESFSPEKLARALSATSVLSNWISHVQDIAYHKLLRGGRIPGFKLVAKRSVRKWTNERDVILTFGPKALGERPVLSPAQLEKKLGKKGKAWISEHTLSQSSGYTLVSDNDKRPAVNLVANDFDVIDD